MTRYIGLYELVAAYRAAEQPAPRPVLEPAQIELSESQFSAMDEMGGITS